MGCLWCLFSQEKDNSLKIDRDWLCIDDICVDENYRRHGIGKQLVDFAIKLAQGKGVDRIQLNVYEDNHSAVRFYENIGFTTQKRVMELNVSSQKENGNTDSLALVQPSIEHENQYQNMMDEWEARQAQHGGWFNPGALRRYSNSQKRTVTYDEWLKWIEDDRKTGQELYFFIRGEKIFGAISIRPKKNAQNIGVDGHCGFGIRPSERKKGYATKMLNMALPIMKKHGINPVVITCDKDNIGSAKVIQNNGGVLVNEIIGENSGKPIQVYHISLCEG